MLEFKFFRGISKFEYEQNSYTQTLTINGCSYNFSIPTVVQSINAFNWCWSQKVQYITQQVQ